MWRDGNISGMPNGTIDCENPDHGVNEPPPPGLSMEDRVAWIVSHAPPLAQEQRERLALLLSPPGQRPARGGGSAG